MKKIIFASLYLIFMSGLMAQPNTAINPGAIWKDTNGNHIQAHGGAVWEKDGLFYWYGEERRQGLDPDYKYVSLYTSTDLLNWTFKGDVFKMAQPDNLQKNWILERPKVYYNKKSKKYVMYFHLDGQPKNKETNTKMLPGYNYAHVGIAISNQAEGPFTFIKDFKPLGHASRDIGQFIDDDGKAYLIFEDRGFGFRIAELSDDYLSLKKQICLIKVPIEGGAIVHDKGYYYVIGSQLTGWSPNANKYAVAKKLAGPWSEFKDIAPAEKKTYGSQSTNIIKIKGTKHTSIIFLGDIWKPQSQWDSRYLWMPLEIQDKTISLPEPRSWKIDIKTGIVNFIKED